MRVTYCSVSDFKARFERVSRDESTQNSIRETRKRGFAFQVRVRFSLDKSRYSLDILVRFTKNGTVINQFLRG